MMIDLQTLMVSVDLSPRKGLEVTLTQSSLQGGLTYTSSDRAQSNPASLDMLLRRLPRHMRAFSRLRQGPLCYSPSTSSCVLAEKGPATSHLFFPSPASLGQR